MMMMPFSSRACRLSALGLLVAHLSIPLTCSLASELSARHDHSPSELWARSNDEKYEFGHKQTGTPVTPHPDKRETARLKSVHRHNARYHKKEQVKRLAKASSCDPTQQAAKRQLAQEKQEKRSQTSSYYSHPHTRKTKPHSSTYASNSSVFGSQAASNSLLHVDSACGKAQPTSSITVNSGPNGHESFFNCGIDADGWNPPEVTMSMIKSSSLDQEPAKTTFAPCSSYRHLFEKHGKAFGIPPIFLAAFAMQESSCQPHVVGDNGGAFGLMQITADKCGGAPNGDCADPDYNIKMGAKTFANGLKESNHNVLKALGGYNGWTTGLTKTQAMKAKSQGCCVCQQNLDYFQQVLNGWILGIDPQSHRLGTERNLDVCGGDH